MNAKTILLFASLLLAPALAITAPGHKDKKAGQPETHRYLIERTFPAGALDNLDAASKAKVNANNAKFRVKWLMSYANAGKTTTYCIYEGPSEDAVREAAKANALPVDRVTEVPVTLTP